MTLDEIEAAFRVGCCASARLASEGCKVCGPQMRAIDAVREIARERDALRIALSTMHRECDRAEAERDAARAARALPVVPATCGECEHLGHAVPGGGHYCTRADKAVVMAYTAIPAHWCPVRVDRAELAKAGVR